MIKLTENFILKLQFDPVPISLLENFEVLLLEFKKILLKKIEIQFKKVEMNASFSFPG